MKKQILLVILNISCLVLRSQILNNSFEDLATDGKIKNWGMAFFTSVVIDSNGVSHGDSIVFDQDLYFSTPDAHTGTKALEMRNAFNYTSNQGISGAARLMSNDSDYVSFAPMADIQYRPLNFSFYYKFFPVAGDTAFASMNIYNSSGDEIGQSIIEITALTNNYTQALQPVTYQLADSAAFIAISFATAKPYGIANFGTRFLVDDVNAATTVTATALYPQLAGKEATTIFPNPVQDHFTIGPARIFSGGGTIGISDMAGKIITQIDFSDTGKEISVDASQLAKGMYSLKITSGQKIYSNTFIK